MLSEKLKDLRENLNLNRKELSIKLELPYTTYINYESGTREPDYDTLKKIASFFEVSVSFLINDGLFAQGKLIERFRNELSDDLVQFLGKEVASWTKTIPLERFIFLLNGFVSKIEYDEDKNALSVYFYISGDSNKPKKTLQSAPFPDLYSLKDSDDIIFLDKLPAEAQRSMRDYFEFLSMKYRKGDDN